MIGFNHLLETVGVDPAKTRLLRHRHNRREQQKRMYLDAIRRDPRFELYQAGQCNETVIRQMRSAETIAGFVADPAGQTVFIGLWQVTGSRDGDLPDPYDTSSLRPRTHPESRDSSHTALVDPAGVGTPEVSGGSRKSAGVIIDMERSDALADYCGRIVIDWGGGERAWVQYAHLRDKRIIELRKTVEEPGFPGFSRFTCGLHELDSLPPGWQEPLRASRGIYLLVHRASGAQYVGSATGIDGFLGRWRGYSNGHGGNVALKELAHRHDEYDVCILETAGSGASNNDIFDLESLWKIKLGSRVQGLNRN